MKNMNQLNHHMAFRVSKESNDLLNAWSQELGHSRSAMARYAIGQLLEYFDDQRADMEECSKSIRKQG